MKKQFARTILVTLLICVLFISGCHKNNEEPKLDKIQNLTESTKEVPECIFFIKGVANYTITEEDLQNINLYDFTISTKDESSKIITNSYSGIRLKDLLKEKEIEIYESINVRGDDVIKIFKEQLSDDIFIIFYKNDELVTDISSTGIILYAKLNETNYEVPGLYRIEII